MVVALHATNDLVVLEWLRTIPELVSGGVGVAATLPEPTSWGASGFVQAMTVGGTADLYLHTGRPVVQVDVWAVKPDNTAKPLWNVASVVMQHVILATRDEPTIRRILTLPSGYPEAQVLEVYPLVEPHRVLSDPGGYARFRCDLQFIWREVGE